MESCTAAAHLLHQLLATAAERSLETRECFLTLSVFLVVIGIVLVGFDGRFATAAVQRWRGRCHAASRERGTAADIFS